MPGLEVGSKMLRLYVEKQVKDMIVIKDSGYFHTISGPFLHESQKDADGQTMQIASGLQERAPT